MKAALKRNAIRLMSLPPLARTMNRVLNQAPVIFTLHRHAKPELGIGGHDPAVLRKQLEFVLRNGYRAVTMDLIDAWVNGEDMDMTNTVAFTFDDGYRDQAELIREVFLPLGVPASMFLITGFIDGRLWPWDTRIKWLIHHAPARPGEIIVGSVGRRERLGHDGVARRQFAHRVISELEQQSPARLEAAIEELASALQMEIPHNPPDCHSPMSWNDARELEKSGVRFGSHSHSHYVFTGLNRAEANDQIRTARARLESELNSPLKTFGYPIGHRSNFTGRELKILREAGHTSAVTMTPGVVNRGEPEGAYRNYVINRYGMPNELEDFLQCVSWIERIKDSAAAVSPRKLVRKRFGSPRGMLETLQTGAVYHLGRLRVTEDIEWSRVQRLVFICRGNVCRSPFAEAVAREHGIPAVSVGMETNPGTRVNPIASRIALELGVDMTEHTSHRFDPAQLRDGDLVLGMEPAHLTEAGADIAAENVQWTLLGLHLRSAKVAYIADPYGSSDAYHRRCFGMIHAAVDALAANRLRSSQGAQSTSRQPSRTPTP